MSERVWIFKRPGESCVDERGDFLPDREFPEDSPVAAMPTNREKLVLVVREVAPEEQTFRDHSGLTALRFDDAEFGEDAED